MREEPLASSTADFRGPLCVPSLHTNLCTFSWAWGRSGQVGREVPTFEYMAAWYPPLGCPLPVRPNPTLPTFQDSLCLGRMILQPYLWTAGLQSWLLLPGRQHVAGTVPPDSKRDYRSAFSLLWKPSGCRGPQLVKAGSSPPKEGCKPANDPVSSRLRFSQGTWGTVKAGARDSNRLDNVWPA